MTRTYRLIGPDGRPYDSPVKGTIGGNTAGLYGRLDCPAALSALRRNPTRYAQKRVFFADEATAVAAGCRPCGRCMRAAYMKWGAGAARERRS